MNRKPGLYASAAILLGMFALTAWAWPQIPPDKRLPVHWAASGVPNGFAGKTTVLLGLPLLAVGLAALLAVIPWLEPRRLNLSQSAKAYTAGWAAILAVIGATQSAAVLYALGRERVAAVIVLAALGGLFLVVGNYLGKVRSNFFFGIRTPWTLSSELSWNKTHRLGGRLFVLLGVALILAAVIGSGGLSFAVALVGSGLIVAVTVVYSFLTWKADIAKQTMGR